MKKFTSQIMAFVLAFCMVAALVPAVPAQAADGDIELNFCIASAANTSLVGLDTSAGGWTWNQAETGSDIVERITVTGNLKNWWSNGPTGQRVSFYNSLVNSQRMAFDFNVEEAGWYDLSNSKITAISSSTTDGSAVIDVISDGAISRAATLHNKVSNTEEFTELETFETEKVYLTEGKNTLVFRGTAIRNTNHTMLWVEKIVFTKTTAPAEIVKKDVVVDFTTDTFGALTGNASVIDKIVDYVAWNWKYNADLTSQGYKNYITSYGTNVSDAARINYGIRPANGCYYNNFATALGNLAFNFIADEAGWYKIDTNKTSASGLGAENSGIAGIYAGSENAPIKLAGKIDAKTPASGQPAVITAENAVYLEKGENLLIIRGIENCTSVQYPNNYTYLRRITFTPVSDDEAPAEATEPYTQYIETNADNVGSELATDAKLLFNGWEVDKEGTSASMYGFLANPDSAGGAASFFKMYYAGTSNYGSRSHMGTYFSWGENNTTFSLKFWNEVAGNYDIGAIAYEHAGANVNGDVYVNGAKAGVITAEATENAYTEFNKTLSTNVYLNKGVNTLTITKTSGGNALLLSKLILTPYVAPEPVEIVNAEIFGDVSAYITKTEEGGFKFTALSAINDTAYTEVGFYIDGVKYAVAGGNVYKSVNVNGTATAVAEFFTESTPAGANDPYIFFSSKDFSAKPGSVEFVPYAVPVEGAEITGHTYTVSLS